MAPRARLSRLHVGNLLPAGGPAWRAVSGSQRPSRFQSGSEDSHRSPAHLLVDLIDGLPQFHLPFPVFIDEKRRLNLILGTQFVQEHTGFGEWIPIPLMVIALCHGERRKSGLMVPRSVRKRGERSGPFMLSAHSSGARGPLIVPADTVSPGSRPSRLPGTAHDARLRHGRSPR